MRGGLPRCRVKDLPYVAASRGGLQFIGVQLAARRQDQVRILGVFLVHVDGERVGDGNPELAGDGCTGVVKQLLPIVGVVYRLLDDAGTHLMRCLHGRRSPVVG